MDEDEPFTKKVLRNKPWK